MNDQLFVLRRKTEKRRQQMGPKMDKDCLEINESWQQKC